MRQSKRFSLNAAARSSLLSRAQVEEVAALLPHIDFVMHWVETRGDKDKITSLRSLEKTDFFTREIDALLLQKKVRLGIHSAKDLPDPLPPGLRIVLLTKGLDPRDCLVLREGENLRSHMAIATSSARREEAVRLLLSNARFVDLRGTIGERLAKLERGEVDGVVVAAAALIRLKLTLNAVYLPGPTAPGQGRLALVGRDDDLEMIELFACESSI